MDIAPTFLPRDIHWDLPRDVTRENWMSYLHNLAEHVAGEDRNFWLIGEHDAVAAAEAWTQ